MNLLVIAVFVFILGAGLFLLVARIALKIFVEENSQFYDIRKFIDLLLQPGRSISHQSVTDAYLEYLQRRNEFWLNYGQLVIAILVLVFLTILLLTEVVSAEAGLPIFSAVAGFSVAKSASTFSKTGPRNPDQ